MNNELIERIEQFDNLEEVKQVNGLWNTLQDCKAALTQQQEAETVGEIPEGFKVCPISGREFWGNIEHPELGLVATYGGPFDTYAIPSMGEDGELRCERFDQDEGAWVEGGEPFGWFYEDQQAHKSPKPAAQPQVPEGMSYVDITTEGFNGCINLLWNGHPIALIGAALAPELKAAISAAKEESK